MLRTTRGFHGHVSQAAFAIVIVVSAAGCGNNTPARQARDSSGKLCVLIGELLIKHPHPAGKILGAVLILGGTALQVEATLSQSGDMNASQRYDENPERPDPVNVKHHVAGDGIWSSDRKRRSDGDTESAAVPPGRDGRR